MKNKVTTPVIKGIVISLLIIIFSMIVYFIGQSGNQTLGYIQYAIFIGGIIWSCILYANQQNGYVTFGNTFAHGFKTAAVVIVLTAIYTFIAFKFLFPDIVSMVIDKTKEAMLKQKNVDDEQIAKTVDLMRKNFVTFAVAGVVFIFGIIGLIASLIGAAVAKKKPIDPFSQINQIGEA